MKTVKLCDNCNSPVTTIKRGKKVSVECSYCGKPCEDVEVNDFMSEKKYGKGE